LMPAHHQLSRSFNNHQELTMTWSRTPDREPFRTLSGSGLAFSSDITETKYLHALINQNLSLFKYTTKRRTINAIYDSWVNRKSDRMPVSFRSHFRIFSNPILAAADLCFQKEKTPQTLLALIHLFLNTYHNRRFLYTSLPLPHFRNADQKPVSLWSVTPGLLQSTSQSTSFSAHFYLSAYPLLNSIYLSLNYHLNRRFLYTSLPLTSFRNADQKPVSLWSVTPGLFQNFSRSISLSDISYLNTYPLLNPNYPSIKAYLKRRFIYPSLPLNSFRNADQKPVSLWSVAPGLFQNFSRSISLSDISYLNTYPLLNPVYKSFKAHYKRRFIYTSLPLPHFRNADQKPVSLWSVAPGLFQNFSRSIFLSDISYLSTYPLLNPIYRSLKTHHKRRFLYTSLPLPHFRNADQKPLSLWSVAPGPFQNFSLSTYLSAISYLFNYPLLNPVYRSLKTHHKRRFLYTSLPLPHFRNADQKPVSLWSQFRNREKHSLSCKIAETALF
jgi:hypothetical protein